MGVPLPPVLRAQSVGLEFSCRAGYPEIALMCELLHVPVINIYGVELVTARRAILKFTEELAYRDFLRRYEGRTLPLPDGAGTVSLSDRSGALTYVSVHGAPLEFPESLLWRYFSRYGAVVSVRVNVVSSSPLKGVRTNIRTLGMRLREDIPSSVRLMGYNVRVFYAHQPRTCYRCGLLGHQAADCSAPAVAPVNLFSEEDFPPLPVEEDSVDVDVSSATDVPPVSPVAPPGAPPVVVASPQDVVASQGDRPAPTCVPGVLQTACCSIPPSSSSSSAASDPVPAPLPTVPAVLGDGVDPALPPVPGLVPHVVEDAAVLRRASVRPACVARLSESASGSDDVRPEPKRSQRSSSAWADVGDFDACGSAGEGGVATVALQTTVTAEGHLSEDASAGVSASTSDMVSAVPASGASPASDGSGSSWGVVPPAEVRGERGLVMVLKKTARSGGSVTPSSVPVSSTAVSTPLLSLAISSVSPAVSVETLPSRCLSPAPVRMATRPSRQPSYASLVSSATSKDVACALQPRYATCVGELQEWPFPPDLEVPEFILGPRRQGDRPPSDMEYLIWEVYKRRYPWDSFPGKYIPVSEKCIPRS
ncbi:uncharacterized protein [Procambarus clarkii]|uniref:uncharacterized protein n=1 Tax=Procambarus clarkii TaxID=6728 RepID=UPI003742C6DE